MRVLVSNYLEEKYITNTENGRFVDEATKVHIMECNYRIGASSNVSKCMICIVRVALVRIEVEEENLRITCRIFYCE